VVLFSVLVVCFFTFWICVVCLSFVCAVIVFFFSLCVCGFYRRAFGDTLPTVVLEGGSVGSVDIRVFSVLDFLSV
jgi:hypothetical protein